MAMIDSADITDLSSRPRRTRHGSGKNYDGEGEKTLELRGVLDALSAYQDCEGGINCCECGKLYKSKVCFIKHLWEHSIYWDLFPGDKNHERVLAIQAALILYAGHMGISMQDAQRLMDLLVTFPNIHETTYPSTPKKRVVKNLTCPKTPEKELAESCSTFHENTCPSTPGKHVGQNFSSLQQNLYPSTPLKEISSEYPSFHRSAYPPTPRKVQNRKRSSSLRMSKMPRKKLKLVLD